MSQTDLLFAVCVVLKTCPDSSKPPPFGRAEKWCLYWAVKKVPRCRCLQPNGQQHLARSPLRGAQTPDKSAQVKRVNYQNVWAADDKQTRQMFTGDFHPHVSNQVFNFDPVPPARRETLSQQLDFGRKPKVLLLMRRLC